MPLRESCFCSKNQIRRIDVFRLCAVNKIIEEYGYVSFCSTCYRIQCTRRSFRCLSYSEKNCRKILVMVFFFRNDLEAAHDCLLALVTPKLLSASAINTPCIFLAIICRVQEPIFNVPCLFASKVEVGNLRSCSLLLQVIYMRSFPL
jgi:hypothetical protein